MPTTSAKTLPAMGSSGNLATLEGTARNLSSQVARESREGGRTQCRSSEEGSETLEQRPALDGKNQFELRIDNSNDHVDVADIIMPSMGGPQSSNGGRHKSNYDGENLLEREFLLPNTVSNLQSMLGKKLTCEVRGVTRNPRGGQSVLQRGEEGPTFKEC